MYILIWPYLLCNLSEYPVSHFPTACKHTGHTATAQWSVLQIAHLCDWTPCWYCTISIDSAVMHHTSHPFFLASEIKFSQFFQVSEIFWTHEKVVCWLNQLVWVLPSSFFFFLFSFFFFLFSFFSVLAHKHQYPANFLNLDKPLPTPP